MPSRTRIAVFERNFKMSEDYEKMKAPELKALLQSKHGFEPPKGMLKSAMVSKLKELDAAANPSPASPAPIPTTAPKTSSPAPAKVVAHATDAIPPKASQEVKKTIKSESPVSSVPAKVAATTSSSSQASSSSTLQTSLNNASSSSSTTQASFLTASSSTTHYASMDDLMSAEKLEARMKRFATPEEQKMQERSERFGVAPPKKSEGQKRVEQAQRKEAALADREAAKARAIKFGVPLKPDLAEENQKKRERLERFKEHLSPNKSAKLEEGSTPKNNPSS